MRWWLMPFKGCEVYNKFGECWAVDEVKIRVEEPFISNGPTACFIIYEEHLLFKF